MAKRGRREKQIETKVNKRVLHELQIPNIPLKLLLGAETGWPDRLYLLGHGAVMFVEYKDPDEGEVAPKQDYIISMMLGMGYDVQIHDEEHTAFEAIKSSKMEAARLSERSGFIPPR